MVALELNIFQKNQENHRPKNIATNIHRIQAKDCVICQCFFAVFIVLLLKDKSLLNYTNLFSPNKYEKNNKMILKYHFINHNINSKLAIYSMNRF